MHELTKKIIDFGRGSSNPLVEPRLDFIITSWIREKALEILQSGKSDFAGKYSDTRTIHQILGLESEEKECSLGHANCYLTHPVEEKMEEKWCEHMDSGCHVSVSSFGHMEPKINFCPICGTPRPVTKTLREVLAKKLRDSCENKGFYVYCNKENWKVPDWDMVADCAISVIENWKGEK